ncbi:uncharacterized protein BDZ99DRAFT_451766 [Mytilinidion resinicola]|uniref:Uncharacterized protein n=1 Tax=Mytilinidion resinicola TaxID=574789 RepID=A0A6A6Y752_9PEZI|nr:uncharacterized protein BDZ99DRAFT_451766 [Mytilinidion resinicola]KAF2804642.1 hypothetical protein BDZ99DRAFT_451766 [Mytilinidion resinicola]
MSPYRLRATCPPRTKIAVVRSQHLHSTPIRAFPRKDDQDRESLNPQSTEYSKSGSDDAAAGGEAAFDPSTTSPEAEKESGEKEAGKHSALNVSPGNREVSEARGSEEGGAQSSPGKEGSERSRTSGGGSAPKAGGGQSG